jgi:hypothetical protein
MSLNVGPAESIKDPVVVTHIASYSSLAAGFIEPIVLT